MKTIGLIVATTIMAESNAQTLDWHRLPDLPDSLGRAGMFAGVTSGRHVVAGGANFPAGYPWEGGKKAWHDDVYVLHPGAEEWETSTVRLPVGLGYGVTGSYNDRIYLVGGSTPTEHRSDVLVLHWDNNTLQLDSGPSLPQPLANMAGTSVGSLLVVVGGMESPTGPPLNVCYGLDMENPDAGWFPLPTWAGEARLFPVTGSYAGELYMFSGETTWTTEKGTSRRHVLEDVHRFTPIHENGVWTGQWTPLGDMPKGVSAGANPAPLIDGQMLFWGGVDRLTALHTDPPNHPGIDRTLVWYNPADDLWSFGTETEKPGSRVTLPTVLWNEKTYYISGEIRPGVRTPEILGLGDQTGGSQ